MTDTPPPSPLGTTDQQEANLGRRNAELFRTASTQAAEMTLNELFTAQQHDQPAQQYDPLSVARMPRTRGQVQNALDALLNLNETSDADERTRRNDQAARLLAEQEELEKSEQNNTNVQNLSQQNREVPEDDDEVLKPAFKENSNARNTTMETDNQAVPLVNSRNRIHQLRQKVEKHTEMFKTSKDAEEVREAERKRKLYSIKLAYTERGYNNLPETSDDESSASSPTIAVRRLQNVAQSSTRATGKRLATDTPDETRKTTRNRTDDYQGTTTADQPQEESIPINVDNELGYSDFVSLTPEQLKLLDSIIEKNAFLEPSLDPTQYVLQNNKMIAIEEAFLIANNTSSTPKTFFTKNQFEQSLSRDATANDYERRIILLQDHQKNWVPLSTFEPNVKKTVGAQDTKPYINAYLEKLTGFPNMYDSVKRNMDNRKAVFQKPADEGLNLSPPNVLPFQNLIDANTHPNITAISFIQNSTTGLLSFANFREKRGEVALDKYIQEYAGVTPRDHTRQDLSPAYYKDDTTNNNYVNLERWKVLNPQNSHPLLQQPIKADVIFPDVAGVGLNSALYFIKQSNGNNTKYAPPNHAQITILHEISDEGLDAPDEKWDVIKKHFLTPNNNPVKPETLALTNNELTPIENITENDRENIHKKFIFKQTSSENGMLTGNFKSEDNFFYSKNYNKIHAPITLYSANDSDERIQRGLNAYQDNPNNPNHTEASFLNAPIRENDHYTYVYQGDRAVERSRAVYVRMTVTDDAVNYMTLEPARVTADNLHEMLQHQEIGNILLTTADGKILPIDRFFKNISAVGYGDEQKDAFRLQKLNAYLENVGLNRVTMEDIERFKEGNGDNDTAPFLWTKLYPDSLNSVFCDLSQQQNNALYIKFRDNIAPQLGPNIKINELDNDNDNDIKNDLRNTLVKSKNGDYMPASTYGELYGPLSLKKYIQAHCTPDIVQSHFRTDDVGTAFYRHGDRYYNKVAYLTIPDQNRTPIDQNTDILWTSISGKTLLSTNRAENNNVNKTTIGNNTGYLKDASTNMIRERMQEELTVQGVIPNQTPNTYNPNLINKLILTQETNNPEHRYLEDYTTFQHANRGFPVNDDDIYTHINHHIIFKLNDENDAEGYSYTDYESLYYQKKFTSQDRYCNMPLDVATLQEGTNLLQETRQVQNNIDLNNEDILSFQGVDFIGDDQDLDSIPTATPQSQTLNENHFYLTDTDERADLVQNSYDNNETVFGNNSEIEILNIEEVMTMLDKAPIHSVRPAANRRDDDGHSR
jgi:hypothetical protein